MAIISFSPDMVVDYIPKYGGNRSSESPCIVGMRFLPYAKAVQYRRLGTAQLREKNGAKKVFEVETYIKRKIFLDNVVTVFGIFVGSREITDVAEFYKIAPEALVSEIMAAMKNAIKLKAGWLEPAPK